MKGGKFVKVSKQAREKYMELCPFSSMKCESLHEIDSKIIRAAKLGNTVSWDNQGSREVLYYHLVFHVKNGVVVDIIKDKDVYYHVSETAKRKYTYEKEKILV